MPVNLDEIGPMRLLLHFLGRLVSSSHFKKASGAANRGKFKAGKHLSSRHTTAQLVLKVSWTPKAKPSHLLHQSADRCTCWLFHHSSPLGWLGWDILTQYSHAMASFFSNHPTHGQDSKWLAPVYQETLAMV